MTWLVNDEGCEALTRKLAFWLLKSRDYPFASWSTEKDTIPPIFFYLQVSQSLKVFVVCIGYYRMIINQSINQSINQASKQSINQSSKQSINQSINHSGYLSSYLSIRSYHLVRSLHITKNLHLDRGTVTRPLAFGPSSNSPAESMGASWAGGAGCSFM